MEAMNLEILRLHPMQNYGTPYDYDVDGFNENGWHSSFIIETTKQQEENDYWSFYQPRRVEQISVAQPIGAMILSSFTTTGKSHH